MFGEVIDLRWGDCDAVARDWSRHCSGAAPEPINPIFTYTDVTCTMTHFLMGPSFSNAIKLTARLGSDWR